MPVFTTAVLVVSELWLAAPENGLVAGLVDNHHVLQHCGFITLTDAGRASSVTGHNSGIKVVQVTRRGVMTVEVTRQAGAWARMLCQLRCVPLIHRLPPVDCS